MKFVISSKLLKLLGVLMFGIIIVLSLLIYKDFNSELYDSWGRALASSIYNFENNLVTN